MKRGKKQFGGRWTKKTVVESGLYDSWRDAFGMEIVEVKGHELYRIESHAAFTWFTLYTGLKVEELSGIKYAPIGVQSFRLSNLSSEEDKNYLLAVERQLQRDNGMKRMAKCNNDLLELDQIQCHCEWICDEPLIEEIREVGSLRELRNRIPEESYLDLKQLVARPIPFRQQITEMTLRYINERLPRRFQLPESAVGLNQQIWVPVPEPIYMLITNTCGIYTDTEIQRLQNIMFAFNTVIYGLKETWQKKALADPSPDLLSDKHAEILRKKLDSLTKWTN